MSVLAAVQGPVRGLVAAASIAAVALLAACTTPNYPPAPRLAATPDYNYVVGPLDTVNIIVWRNPELSMSVPVRPDGKITFPLVEDLPALGNDPTTLARDVEKALAKYIRDPIVTIIVTSFVGPYDQTVRVIGEAAKPQTLAPISTLRGRSCTNCARVGLPSSKD